MSDDLAQHSAVPEPLHLGHAPDVVGELVAQRERIAAIEVELAALRRKLDGRESTSDAAQVRFGGDPRLADVVAVTKDMFPGEPTIEVMTDPEDSDHPFVVLTVERSGDSRELIQLQLEWHKRIDKISSGPSTTFRLSVAPI